jgi:hypothetical protein
MRPWKSLRISRVLCTQRTWSVIHLTNLMGYIVWYMGIAFVLSS